MLKEHMMIGIEERIKLKIVKNEEQLVKMVYYLETGRMVELSLVNEGNIIIFDTYTDYEKITEDERIEHSEILKDIYNRMRFTYRDKLFIMPWEYIENFELYKERVGKKVENEIAEKIIKKIDESVMNSEEKVMLEMEENKEELCVFGIGEDLEEMLEVMTKKGWVKFKKIGKHFFEIEIEEKRTKEISIKEKIFRMITFAREMKREKYNVWVNYR